ncbi:hypothetical protein V2O64_19845 [Verrucomicrobiaceae bacterium 227]
MMQKYPFILGGLLAAIAWVIAWPESESAPDLVEAPEVPRRPRPALRTAEQLQDLSERLKDSSDRVRQRDAARELTRLRTSELHDLLREMVGNYSGNYWDYPESAKLLFVELGRRDAAAALSWVWRNLREARGWSHAFEQIGPQWAWDDPGEFFQFTKDHLREGSHERDLSMKELLASPDPILGDGEVNDVQLWLVKSSPRLAFELLRSSGAMTSQAKMIEDLHTGADFASALSAWDDYDPEAESEVQKSLNEALEKRNANPVDEAFKKAVGLVSREFQMVQDPSRNATVRAISERWKESDPEGFAESPYAGWDRRPE